MFAQIAKERNAKRVVTVIVIGNVVDFIFAPWNFMILLEPIICRPLQWRLCHIAIYALKSLSLDCAYGIKKEGHAVKFSIHSKDERGVYGN
ncbi:MAG: hypothetical protein ACREBB_05245 [Nitrosotalea sp.]